MTEDPDLIPLDVATEGKPAIAAFLMSVHSLRRDDIADRLDVTTDTARKYLTRFDRDRESDAILPNFNHWLW
jgi:hypothetical protein